MLAFDNKKTQTQKLPFFIAWQFLALFFIQLTLGAIVLPAALAQANFDNDAYATLLEDEDKRIKDLRKKRLQRDADLLKEEAEAKKSDDLRKKRPLFGSRNVDGDDGDDSDDSDENKNKIFESSVKKRDRDRQLHVTLRLDVDDDDQLDSMKPDPTKKKDEKEDEKAKAEKEREEDKELAKRREERKEAFDDLTDKPYFAMDWVPSAPDATSNGGFGLLDGNGRPVPYHLNGHPNLQRGMPWDLDD
ncbi:MAG: hypothetical protein P4L53_19295 [Candidatus Obscuribacterales bacterium]|nr:hypothetical protein [Candidatus Obscuribacterales bacterium]